MAAAAHPHAVVCRFTVQGESSLERWSGEQSMAAAHSHAVVCRFTVQGESLLERWSGEQSMAAAHSLHAARGALLEVQAQAQKQKQNLNAQRCATNLTSRTVGGFRQRFKFVPVGHGQRKSSVVSHGT